MSDKKEIFVLPRMGNYVAKPEEWVTHRRSKNYVAKITGLDPNYGFEREFLERVRVGRRTYFQLEDFEIGGFYEIFCAYYTRSGKEDLRLHVFLRLKEIQEDKLIFEVVDEDEIIRYFEQRTPKEVVEEAQKLINEKDEVTLSLEELQSLKDALLKKIRELGDLIRGIAVSTKVEFSWEEGEGTDKKKYTVTVNETYIRYCVNYGDWVYIWSTEGVKATVNDLVEGIKVLRKALKVYETRAKKVIEEAKRLLQEEEDIGINLEALKDLKKEIKSAIERIGQQLLDLAMTDKLEYSFRDKIDDKEEKIYVTVCDRYIRYSIGSGGWIYLKSEYGSTPRTIGGYLRGLKIMKMALENYKKLQTERLKKAKEVFEEDSEDLSKIVQDLEALRDELKRRISDLGKHIAKTLGNGTSFEDSGAKLYIKIKDGKAKIKWKGTWFGYGENYLGFLLNLYEFLKNYYKEKAKEAIERASK